MDFKIKHRQYICGSLKLKKKKNHAVRTGNGLKKYLDWNDNI